MPIRSRARSRRAATASSEERLSDADLVARCAGGDERAWAELVERYRRLIYTIPYRMGLDPADADEIFQVTFTRLTERLGSLKEPSRVRAWLVTTARRLALNAAARRKNFDSEVSAAIADPADLPSETLSRLEEQQLVRIALSRLSGPCRRLLTLLYYPAEGAGKSSSYESVARELGIPIGSVGPTRLRCLRKLLTEFRSLSDE
ncbi:MAG: RNA polymerase sigma factor [Candidatus Eiseniibacteriota bacterium]